MSTTWLNLTLIWYEPDSVTDARIKFYVPYISATGSFGGEIVFWRPQGVSSEPMLRGASRTLEGHLSAPDHALIRQHVQSISDANCDAEQITGRLAGLLALGLSAEGRKIIYRHFTNTPDSATSREFLAITQIFRPYGLEVEQQVRAMVQEQIERD